MKFHVMMRFAALFLTLLLTLSACTTGDVTGTQNNNPTGQSSFPTGTTEESTAPPTDATESTQASDPTQATQPTESTPSTEATDATQATKPTEGTQATVPPTKPPVQAEIPALSQPDFDLSDVPEFSGDLYVSLNGGNPTFYENQYTTTSYEYYSQLDRLGRCGTVVACIGIDLMPTDSRGSISSVTPSGWVQASYSTDLIPGGYLYNRSHLIGWQLTGENANEQNLITGTKEFNQNGMLPFENMVADYIKETENHVLYRVTPVYDGSNLVAHGIHLEAWSVEDYGDGICLNVFIYNVQPGIVIDYATGASQLESDTEPEEGTGEEKEYILNTNTHKFHSPDCRSAANIKPNNKESYTGTRESLIEDGYSPCGNCDP